MKTVSAELKDLIDLCKNKKAQAKAETIEMSDSEFDDLCDDIADAEDALKSNNPNKMNSAIQVLKDYKG